MSIKPNLEKLNKIFKELDQQPPVVTDPEFPPAEPNVWNGPIKRANRHGVNSAWIPPNWNGDWNDMPGAR